MGKPRLIILIRHAQSEGNKNREIHQKTPDHRVPLTAEGWDQAHEAGRKLRSLLRPTDTLHLFVSPYLRTRQTAEGLLEELTSDDPAPTPFPRETIKVYEEPRLREQDFGNFQPNAAEMSRMWQERADYGHFFYRIPNGESAADAYDRVSGFNDSLWRRFEESDFASVCILVTHGLMARVFLMKWYHYSVEYFEDLRNINHCEFVVMRKSPDGRNYVLQNQLRTWTELKRERAARGSISQVDILPVPVRRKWGGCPEGCSHEQHHHNPRTAPRKPPVRQNTADLFSDDNEPIARTPPRVASGSPLATGSLNPTSAANAASGSDEIYVQDQQPETQQQANTLSFSKMSLSQIRLHRPSLLSLGGRDGGGSKSGAASGENSSEEDDPTPLTMGQSVKTPWPTNGAGDVQPRSLARAMRGELGNEGGTGRAMADALGDQSDASLEKEDAENGDKEREKVEMEQIVEAEKRDRSISGSVY